MPKYHRITRPGLALTRTHRLSLAGVAALGTAALTFSLVPGGAEASSTTELSAATASTYAQRIHSEPVQDVRASITDQAAGAMVKAEAVEAKKKAADAAAAKKAAEARAARDAAARKAAQERAAEEAASRSAQRPRVEQAAAKTYANNLDGWIREALDIMKRHDIPGTYEGLHRNIMRESSGNPNAINDWDINAINGVPSIGLLQIIKPTFDAYHVPGTAWSQYDPVANLTAAANYAAHRYGSIDNVNSAY
ncbi:transglycosylase SLT domain-containing protein [Streptomyces minutiscleroticus]|uniref:Transglycosylase SLT domain-containing protein n=1 Tax=Streptomyces minutiscleroticus TaxID=68238 RepID=A0A918NLC3_9ACTN|nr:transglycosylase SLT domain-containing protein [Streptomyces minutiscleroticus]GGX78541.1 hypothetical protein GCM10010358_36030 [Streptomyces minutiscleroticus]